MSSKEVKPRQEMKYDSWYFQLRRKNKHALKLSLKLAESKLFYGLSIRIIRALDFICKLLRIRRFFDYEAEIFICKEKRFICLAIPLCGTHAIRKALRNHLGSSVRVSKASIDQLLDQNPAYADYFKCTFIRNPWARVVSCYNKKILNNDSSISSIPISARCVGLPQQPTFEDFITWLCSSKGTDELADKHWRSQSTFLSIENGINWDFIGQLETFDADLQTVFSKINCELIEDSSQKGESGFSMKKKPAHHTYESFYNDTTKALIANRYSKDIEFAKYVFASEEATK